MTASLAGSIFFIPEAYPERYPPAVYPRPVRVDDLYLASQTPWPAGSATWVPFSEDARMTEILQKPSRANLISAIEGNLSGIISAYCSWPQAEVHYESGIQWSMTDIPFPLFNSIVGARLSPDEIDGTVLSIVSKAKQRQVPLLWWIGPLTQPSDLGRHLERHGFVNEGDMQGMAVYLANLNEDVPMPAGLMVDLVTDDEARRQWSRVCAAGFGMPDFVAEAFHAFMCHADPESVLAYIGWLNGTPVATSLLVLEAGVAGIYNVTTLPEARGQGIGAFLTLTPLQEARQRHYKVGILQATRMGVNIYRSLGFLEYCKIGQYVWEP